MSPCKLCFAGALLPVVMMVATAAIGQESNLLEQVAEDSELTLEMEGALTARVRIIVGETVNGLVIEKGGETHRFEIPQEECLSLWEYCLRRDALSLDDASAERLVPDQTHFVLTFRIGSAVNRFSIDGIDDLEDPRYREIVRAILSLCTHYYPELEQ